MCQPDLMPQPDPPATMAVVRSPRRPWRHCHAGEALLVRHAGPLVVLGEPDGSIDERDMGERLGEISDLTLGDRIVFLREQPEIVAQRDEPLEELDGFVVAPDQM